MRGNYAFHGWIRDSLHKNIRYDEFARAVLVPQATWQKTLPQPGIGK